jgi:hypothetical protein
MVFGVHFVLSYIQMQLLLETAIAVRSAVKLQGAKTPEVRRTVNTSFTSRNHHAGILSLYQALDTDMAAGVCTVSFIEGIGAPRCLPPLFHQMHRRRAELCASTGEAFVQQV